MDTLLFNINDLTLLLVIAQGTLLALILWLVRDKPGQGNGLLAALLLAFAAQALDTLMYWSVPIRQIVAGLGVWPFFVLKWAPLVQGPLLYWYVRTRLTGQPNAKAKLWHFAPLALYPLVIVGIAAELGEARWQSGVGRFGDWFASSLFVLLLWAQKISALTYGVISWLYLQRHGKALEQAYSNPASAQPQWLNMVVIGFAGIWLWHLFGGVAELLQWLALSHIMGVTINYLSFAFVTALVFYSLLKSQVVAPVYEEPAAEEASGPSELDMAEAQRLQRLLREKGLYLNPELTVEELARTAHLSERQVSSLINQCLNKNFFELVNDARLEKAKELLASEDWPIQRVLEESGFNSKATFNRIFKRYVDITPTEYRKRHSAV